MQTEISQPSNEILSISQIRRDGDTQPRSRINQDVVSDYAEDMLNGKVFPPVVIFFDGQYYWLADGFHRVKAEEEAGTKNIKVDLRHGTHRDAILHSVGANSAHGLRRTAADKRRAVVRLLSDPEWAKWSNMEIARKCGVNEGLVRSIKRELSSDDVKMDQDYIDHRFGVDQQTAQEAKQHLEEIPSQRIAQRKGTIYSIDTTNIGKANVDTQSTQTNFLAEEHPPTSDQDPPSAPVPTPQIEQVTQSPSHSAPSISPMETTIGKRQRAKDILKPGVTQPQEKAFVVTPRRLSAGSTWRLGRHHLLYCGRFDEPKFQNLLPRQVELFVQVTPTFKEISQSIPAGTVSGLVLFTPYGGERDLRLFRELIQNAVDLYTDPGESIVLASLPDPSLFILMEELNARCFCAEPDIKHCEDALTAWTAIGKQVQRG